MIFGIKHYLAVWKNVKSSSKQAKPIIGKISKMNIKSIDKAKLVGFMFIDQLG